MPVSSTAGVACLGKYVLPDGRRKWHGSLAQVVDGHSVWSVGMKFGRGGMLT